MASGWSSSSHSLGSSSGPQRVRPVAYNQQGSVNGVRDSGEDRNIDFLCPICFELIEEAHITHCGHTYCYGCITKALSEKGRCPKCFANTGLDEIFPNFLLNELVTKYKNKLLSLKLSQPLGAGESHHSNGLKDFVAAGSKNLSLPDVNVMLEVLTQRKYILEAETCSAQNELLYEFLKHLRIEREEKLNQLTRELTLIKKDMEEVEGILKNVETAKTTTKMSPEISDTDMKSLTEKTPGSDGYFGSRKGPDSSPSSLAVRRNRLHTHFDDVVKCYFSTRAKELLFGGGKEDSAGEPDSSGASSGLNLFRENLVKFSRYSCLRPLATLNYSSDIFNNSTIVSSIEFDKDNEFFAIGGVTKLIKVYDYGSVICDSVDIHYPCVEMRSSSKISCVSWNAYHKATLASSDYEGTITVWDASSGLKMKTFQEHEKRCWSVDFNNIDTRLIASGSDDARVKLWDLNNAHSVASLEAKANVCCVKFNPCSSYNLAFGSADHCVHYYDLRKMKEALSVFKGHRKAVSYVKFLNKEDIVSASTDSQLKMWNVNQPHCLRSFVGHINEKNFVGLATDGDYVACGSENNSLYVYYKGFTKQLFNFKFDAVRSVLEMSNKEDDVNDFVSAVCWRPLSNVVVAANSQGIIKILELVAKPDFKKGSTRVFHGLTEDFLAVSVVGLGECNAGYDEQEEIDQGKENVRLAAAAGAKALEAEGVNDIEIESLGDAEAAAEGITLQLWKYEELKCEKKQKGVPAVHLQSSGDPSEDNAWQVGLVKAEAQNLARRLTDTPANLMTPTIFAENAVNILSNDPRIKVIPRDCGWAKEMNMNAFLGVAKGSLELPIFLEIHYKGGDPNSNPVVFVGKGVTFDSGGISIKPAASMEEMRGDMGGGACVFSSIYAAARLNLPINITGLIPLCENMPSSNAVKPGDVVRAMNGKTIEVVNTDAEGRLILADALHYASSFNPSFVLDIATLTGAMRVALGGGATGVFTNSTQLWSSIHSAGVYTGDRMWRFPLWNLYSKRVANFPRIDVSNVGKGKGGGSCTAAAFLKEFAPSKNWIHLDIAGVMGPDDDISYISKGMTGRPTRTLIQMLSTLK